MTHTALSAIAAIVAIATLISLAVPASAQSDESAGRIVVHKLDDGRVEFDWQPRGGEQVLPAKRYFPASGAPVGSWLRSSPVEVDGVEIGRINARLLDDGRIEFGFTPTDGERILPPARHLPADAQVGRWLRSTEITISIAASTRYTAVSAGGSHTCGLRDTGEIECWGDSDDGRPLLRRAVSPPSAPACRALVASATQARLSAGDGTTTGRPTLHPAVSPPLVLATLTPAACARTARSSAGEATTTGTPTP